MITIKEIYENLKWGYLLKVQTKLSKQYNDLFDKPGLNLIPFVKKHNRIVKKIAKNKKGFEKIEC